MICILKLMYWLMADVMLLADVFETFRTVCHNKNSYGLDPIHYYYTLLHSSLSLLFGLECYVKNDKTEFGINQ